MPPALSLPVSPTPCVRRRAQSGQPLRFPKTMHGRYPWFGGPPDARIGSGNGSFVVKIQSLGRLAALLGGRLPGIRRLPGIFGKRRVAEVAEAAAGGAEYGDEETTSPRIVDEAPVRMVREAGTARSESRSGRNVNGTLNAVLGALIVLIGVFATLAYTSTANFQRGINDRIDGLSDRIDRLSERVAENSRAIAANTAAIEANARAIAANARAIAANTRSIEEVRQGVAENTRLIYQVIERIARIEGILESHFGTLASQANSTMPAT